MINIAILGYGTVGSGVYEVIKNNQEIVDRKSGKHINIKYVLDLRKFPGDPVEDILTDDFEKILNDEDVRIVAEVMGGVEPAYTFAKKALLKGKSVVTSNKELVAAYGQELIAIAASQKANFLFEASVGGGIPIIRPLCSSLTADCILEIKGILNGTTNYILTKMAGEGSDFDETLKEAQALGYAEKDPTNDIEGFDSVRKLAILSSLAYKKTVDFKDIYTEGITKITKTDIEYAKALNSTIKLIGESKLEGDKITAKVAPLMIKNTHPIAMVGGVFNAIFINGNMSGDTMYYGSGAGKLPTASAVVSDIIDAARHVGVNVRIDWDNEKMPVVPAGDTKVCAMIRFAKKDAETEKRCVAAFDGADIIRLEGHEDEFALLTKAQKESDIKDELEKLGEDVLSFIRMEG
ncbi:MAG: homoserine dehydrogenase [Firmicutes bacterium]|nr:homoserine dehydrogenase [Bacillota bacterium]